MHFRLKFEHRERRSFHTPAVVEPERIQIPGSGSCCAFRGFPEETQGQSQKTRTKQEQ